MKKNKFETIKSIYGVLSSESLILKSPEMKFKSLLRHH